MSKVSDITNARMNGAIQHFRESVRRATKAANDLGLAVESMDPPRPRVWNVWWGYKLLGIVNESTAGWARDSAARRWSDFPEALRVIEATRDPYRHQTTIRPKMIQERTLH